MFANKTIRTIAACGLIGLFLLASIAALAGDNRINMPPYHFGGDTLFCNRDEGCNLLDLNGHLLKNWKQVDIISAFDAMDETGEGQGTYGAVSLWAVVSGQTNGNKTLCLQGFDEWGKQNRMCFEVTTDFIYQQVPLPVAATQAVEHPILTTFTAVCMPPNPADNLPGHC